MKIILTNDDGYAEPGLAALKKSVEQIADTIVVAPKSPQSCAGHRVTLNGPIPVTIKNDNTFIVDGSPADCARLAIKQFACDSDWLIAGINPGANLGTDVYQSGTVAAAREAAILGCNSISISQYISPNQTINWDVTVQHVTRILLVVMEQTLHARQFLNINIPHPLNVSDMPEIKFCCLDKNPHDYSYQFKSGSYFYNGSIHKRPRSIGKDVDICFGGSISVTRIDI